MRRAHRVQAHGLPGLVARDQLEERLLRVEARLSRLERKSYGIALSDAEIDRIQYRRKVPRCDRCEGDVWQSALSAQVDSWNRAAFEQRSRP